MGKVGVSGQELNVLGTAVGYAICVPGAHNSVLGVKAASNRGR